MTLGVEVVNRYETNVCNTARQAMELLADVDAAALRVHLDTYHMNIEEFSMADAVRTCGDKLGCDRLSLCVARAVCKRPACGAMRV